MTEQRPTMRIFRAGAQINYKGQHLEIMSACRERNAYFAYPVEVSKRQDREGNFVMIQIAFGDPEVTLAPERVAIEPVSAIGMEAP